jgi:anti-sigma B factor antagonist
VSTTTTDMSHRPAGQKTVLDLNLSNVDFRNCESIKQAIHSLSAENPNMVLNLSSVTFMDSSGLGVVLFGKRTCESAGGSFSLYGLQSYVFNLIKLTNLHRAVSIFESEEEATQG